MTTPNNGIPYVPENTVDPAAGLNLSLLTIDALLQLMVETIGATTPPVSPVEAERHVVGVGATGAWAGQDNQLAVYDSVSFSWDFYAAHLAVNKADGMVYAYVGSTWQIAAGTTTFAGLNDTPAGFAGAGGKLLAVTSAEDAVEYVEVPLGWPVKRSPTVSAGALTLDLVDPASFVVALDQDVTTLTLANANGADYAKFALVCTQDNTGGWTITWPASFQNTPAQPEATANATTLQEFVTWDGGSTVYPLDRFVLAAGGAVTWDGILYLVDEYGYVEAVDSVAQTSSWQNLDGYNGAGGDFYRAAVNDTKVFAIDADGLLWVFDKTTGASSSSFSTGMGFPAGVAADNSDALYVVSQASTDLIKFDINGNTLWTFPLPQNTADGNAEYGVSVALGTDGYLYVASGVDAPALDYLFKIDPADGSQVWAAPSSGTSAYAIGMALGPNDSVYVYIANDDGSGPAQDTLRKYDNAGTLLWTLPLGQYFSSEVKMSVDDDGTCYSVNNQSDGATFNSTLIFRVDTNGTLVDNTQEAVILSGIEARDGVVYVLEANNSNNENHLVARNPADWAELWRLAILDGTYGRPVQAIVSYTA